MFAAFANAWANLVANVEAIVGGNVIVAVTIAVAAIMTGCFGPLLLLLAAVRGAREQRALAVLQPAALAEPLLVIVPARNEEARLPSTLQALLQDPSPHLRVVVVDDRSTDGTAAIVIACTDPRVRLLRQESDPPAGSFGKPCALAAAVAADVAGTPLVAIVDADVVVGVGALGGLVSAHRAAGASATSGLPALNNQGFVENLLVPAFVAAVAVTHPPSRVQAGEIGFLNGQFLLVSRVALDEVGGFEAVEHTVLEDVELARLLVKNKHRLKLVDARNLVSTRMYDGFAAIVAGFGKNAVALHGKATVMLAVLLVATSWAPWWALLLAWPTVTRVDDVVAAVGWVISVGLMMLNRRRLRSPALYGLLSPLSQLVVAAVYLRAVFRRRASWRGRDFAT